MNIDGRESLDVMLDLKHSQVKSWNKISSTSNLADKLCTWIGQKRIQLNTPTEHEYFCILIWGLLLINDSMTPPPSV